MVRYAFRWWREKEIVSEERRSQGLCPLTPEETALVLRALGFSKETPVYVASGEIYGSERRLAALRAEFPRTVSFVIIIKFMSSVPQVNKSWRKFHWVIFHDSLCSNSYRQHGELRSVFLGLNMEFDWLCKTVSRGPEKFR